MKRILVVDDDSTFGEMVRAAVNKELYTVVTAADGVKGVESVTAATPDAILLDMQMPNMGGIDFLRKMKDMGKGEIPVIITSNDSSMDTISKGTEFGVRGYIIKSNESLKTIVGIVERLFDPKV